SVRIAVAEAISEADVASVTETRGVELAGPIGQARIVHARAAATAVARRRAVFPGLAGAGARALLVGCTVVVRLAGEMIGPHEAQTARSEDNRGKKESAHVKTRP